jgi:hypothetical protein
LKQLWKTSPPLTATGLAMIPLLVAFVIGVVVDPRELTGMPIWMKPAKFAASIAIYTLTLAWIFTLLPEWPRTRAIVGWTTAVTLVLEIVLIAMQAARGQTSHFNVASPFDGVVFSTMGLAILVQTLSMVAVAVALWRYRFADRALGWALRLGVTLTIIGASAGGLMVTPTTEQIADARAGKRMLIAGAHTVGAPDGGPGLPGTGWSTTHGDLRVPHFLGLHAMQALPIFALTVSRRRVTADRRARLVVIGSVVYLGLFAALLMQALRGTPLVAL